MTYEGLRLKVLKYVRKIPANLRRRSLYSTKFTIISNNCWGGMIYESYNIPKQSPTVGLFFSAEDYIEFISNLKHYLHMPLKFINTECSKNIEVLKLSKNYESIPVAMLDDKVEIVFLHYHSKEEANDKWMRRCKRINYDRLLVKFNDQNGCTQEHLKAFLSLPYAHKVFFTCKKWPIEDSAIIKIRQPKVYKSITASHEPFGKRITTIINQM